MKKDLLFIMNNLNYGGAEKALISLLETIDYSSYNVDLLLFKHEGLFLTKIPVQVKLLEEPIEFKFFDMPTKIAIINSFKKGRLDITTSRIGSGFIFKTEKNNARCEQRVWKFISRTIKKMKKEYDAAIGFQEKNPIYFCVDKVQAKVKIGWIHTDYNKLGLNLEKERTYFNQLDYVVTVSEELRHILQNLFPAQQQKFKCIYNIVSPKMIEKMANEKIELEKNGDKGIKLISVGRLAKEKGLDIAMEAFVHLTKKGYNLKWYLIGEGNVREYLEGKIKENDLEEKVILLGQKENPYPYIKQADIYLQTSRYEGKSISIDEAKILAKPILITNFETAADHIQHGEDGLISEMDPLSVADELERLINNQELREKLSSNLRKKNLGTEGEINRLYQLTHS